MPKIPITDISKCSEGEEDIRNKKFCKVYNFQVLIASSEVKDKEKGKVRGVYSLIYEDVI